MEPAPMTCWINLGEVPRLAELSMRATPADNLRSAQLLPGATSQRIEFWDLGDEPRTAVIQRFGRQQPTSLLQSRARRSGVKRHRVRSCAQRLRDLHPAPCGYQFRADVSGPCMTSRRKARRPQSAQPKRRRSLIMSPLAVREAVSHAPATPEL